MSRGRRVARKSVHIDALRGVAILAVVQYHYGSTSGLYRWADLPTTLQGLGSLGFAGVDLFFVLSAFLLTRNLLVNRDAPGVVGAFYRRRVLRILPLYLMLLFAAMTLRALWRPEETGQGQWLLGGLAPGWVYGLFLQNFWNGLNGHFAGHFLAPTWSLAIEEHFYLVLPLLILRLDARQARRAALALIVAAPVIRFLVEARHGPVAAATFSFARVDSLGWGMLAASLASTGAGRARFSRIWSALGVAAFVAAGLVSLSGVGLWVPVAYSVTALVAAHAVLHVATPRAPAPEGALLRVLAWAGSRCYSLYLLHMPVAGLTAMAAGRETVFVGDAGGALVVLASALLLVLVAEVAYRFIERPFIDYGERRVRYRSAEARPAT